MTQSELIIHTVERGREEVVYSTDDLIEAPNWSLCGSFLIVNGGGEIYRLDWDDARQSLGSLTLIKTGSEVKCNNDNGISPDGETLVISDSGERGSSCIYTLPIKGGQLTRITDKIPSYWHGWSPDGERFAYTARREGIFNIFIIGINGGEETQLTFGPGHRDGPDYTPDGQWIWFNSDHHGNTPDLWRIRPDGSGLEQMTDDPLVNWFSHPLSDGETVLYLAYPSHVEGPSRGEDVELKLMSPNGGEARTCARFYGGQGSTNVPNWSPSSKQFAYMRYVKG